MYLIYGTNRTVYECGERSAPRFFDFFTPHRAPFPSSSHIFAKIILSAASVDVDGRLTFLAWLLPISQVAYSTQLA